MLYKYIAIAICHAQVFINSDDSAFAGREFYALLTTINDRSARSVFPARSHTA